MGKLINDSITLLLCKILKLVCSKFCTFILFSFIIVCIELCGETQLKTVYKFTLDWIEPFTFLFNTYIFKFLYILSKVNYWSKVTVDLEL